MRITTKTGDKGETSLFAGERVKKSDVFVRALGDLDELTSFLGLAKCAIKDGFDRDIIDGIQNDIYRIMSVVGNKFASPGKLMPIGENDISYLERRIEEFEKICRGVKGFVKVGVSEISARLHVARSVCRRAERTFVEAMDDPNLEGEGEKNAQYILKYLNRLSDLLFLVAISVEKW